MVHSGPYTVNPTRPTLERKLVQVRREFLSGRGQDTWSRQATTIGCAQVPRSCTLSYKTPKQWATFYVLFQFFNRSIPRVNGQKLDR